MSRFTDILARTDAILQKYEHYDESEKAKRRSQSGDPFTDKYFEIMDEVQALNLKSESLAGEKNRALRAAMNAELRKDKQFLLDELPALRQLVSSKGATPEVEQERMERYEEVKRAVEDLSDNATGGTTLRPQRTEFGSDGRQYTRTVMLDGEEMDRALSNPEAYQHTGQTSEFVREATSARQRQDVALDNIELGLSTLKELGTAMGEELERHDGIIDEVGTKMDSATKEMQNNNARLKGLVMKVRSTRRFFIDLILICVVLALGLFIYNIVSHP